MQRAIAKEANKHHSQTSRGYLTRRAPCEDYTQSQRGCSKRNLSTAINGARCSSYLKMVTTVSASKNDQDGEVRTQKLLEQGCLHNCSWGGG